MRYTILRGPRLLRNQDESSRGQLDGVSDSTSSPALQTEDLTRAEARDLDRDPTVAARAPVMPTRLVAPFSSGPGAGPAWSLESLGTFDPALDGAGVAVALLDTGIDATHAAFQGIARIEQIDYAGEGDGDRNGHGTHCAGTFFGRDCEERRIGVARGVGEVYVAKVLGDEGGGTTDMLVRAIAWAAEQGARVISMSLGFDFPGMVKRLEEDDWPTEMATSRALEAYRSNLRLFDTLIAHLRVRSAFGGVVVVAAAGNESRRDTNPNFRIATSLPAAADGVISVGALERTRTGLRVAGFSNTEPMLCAPGVDIVSAGKNGGLATLSGTSMATPHVAGIAALWWQALTNANMPQRLIAPTVIAKLLATSRMDEFDADADPADYGAGRVTLP